LFIVGKWNLLIDFAKEIRDYFTKWTCHNPNLSLSGGIAIIEPKFPIIKGAKLSEEAENIAKEYSYKKFEKNAFTIMGIPLHWEIDFPLVEDYKKLNSSHKCNFLIR
jgi:CRISPR-associated protein Csm1